MKKETIEDVVAQVLKNSSEPLSSKEITGKILEQKMYSFKSQAPDQIVARAIRRSCEGVNIRTSKGKKKFKQAANGKYVLNN